MTAPFIKLLKTWLVLLSIWLVLLTFGFIVSLVLYANVSLYDPGAMSTSWSGNSLNIVTPHSGRFLVTHLVDATRGSFAELPKPLLVVSSGGVLIPESDLAKLTWILPPDLHDSAFPGATNQAVAPAVGARIEALYLFPATAKFTTR